MIAINGRYSLRAQPTGVQRAAATLADALVGAAPETFRRVNPPPHWSIANRIGAQLWEQFGVCRAARRAGCDWLINPMQTGPLVRRGVRQVVVVHDLHFLHHPEWFGFGFRAWNRLATVQALRRADHVVAISDYVLADVRRTCGIPVERSSRIYNIGPALPPPRTRPRIPDTILCVNPYQPHKNLPRVIEAFRLLRAQHPGLQLRLVGRAQENFAAVSGARDLASVPGVRVLGYLDDEALAAEYERCSIFCYASLAEGFGLPILEAAAHGAVIVTSTAGALPEVAGDGAVYVEPHSVESIARGLPAARLMKAERREQLAELSRDNLARFSADRAVQAFSRLCADLATRAQVAKPAGSRWLQEVRE